MTPPAETNPPLPRYAGWMLRVEGQEYGPVSFATLEEWRDEGRLIPTNELRRSTERVWTTAAHIAGLFGADPEETAAAAPVRPARGLGNLLAETFQIYGKAFPQFLCLTLLVAIPSFLFQLGIAGVQMPSTANPAPTMSWSLLLTVVMLLVTIAAWPLSLAALQLLAADLQAGRAANLTDVLRRARAIWPRVAKLCLAVYGAYFFWTVVPGLAAFSFAGEQMSIGGLLFSMLALLFMLYMAARLFINFLFWQQTASLTELPVRQALLESKQLARSRSARSVWHRPVYRGTIIVTLWLIALLVISAAIQMPFVLVRMRTVGNLEDAVALLRTLADAHTPDLLTFAGDAISSLVHAALRPLLAIAMCLLYLDTKANADSPNDS